MLGEYTTVPPPSPVALKEAYNTKRMPSVASSFLLALDRLAFWDSIFSDKEYMIFIPEHLFIGGKKIIDFLAVKKYNDIAGKKRR